MRRHRARRSHHQDVRNRSRRRVEAGWERLESRQLLATIVVNSTADSNARDNSLTLREAILVANGTLPLGSLTPQEQALVSGTLQSGTSNPPDVIAFNIPASGVQTIAPPVPLPEVTDPVIIDATTQPNSELNTAAIGTNAVLRIELWHSLVLNGSSTVRGLSMPAGGLFLRGGNNLVAGSFIGVLPDGATAPGLAAGAPPQTGVIVESSGNSIGGSALADRNLISGNNQSGILVRAGANGTSIRGNLIGSNAAATGAVPNGTGLRIRHASNTTLGGSGAAEGNLISGNTTFGVRVERGSASEVVSGLTILGNRIGTTGDGSGALGNGAGLTITAQNVTVGGTNAGAGNLISGNPGGGLGIANATGVSVVGNRIGTNLGGTQAIGNGEAGLAIQAGANVVVGGTTFESRNVISGNLGHGVFVSNPGAGTAIRGNYIGVDANGVAPLRNEGSGVRVDSATNGILIGGGTLSEGNVISYNGNGGVVVESGTRVTIRTNSIYGNLGPGIDLGANGPTPNDPGDPDVGPNTLLNVPVLTNVSGDGTITTITGSYNGPPSTQITLQFFSSPFADPTGLGEGQIYLGEASVTTDASGNVNFVASVASGTSLGQPVSATAIDPNGNTSEFGTTVPRTSATVNDLVVNVTSNADAVVAGQPVTYTISVNNSGANPATNVSLVSGIGAGSLIDTVELSQGTFSTVTGSIEASLGTIGPGQTATATVVTRTIFAGTTFVSGLAYAAETEATQSNNFAFKLVTVNPGPDLTVSVSAPTIVAPGQNVTFTYTVINTGPGTASGVVFTSSVPAGASFVSTQSSVGTSSQSGGVVTANLGMLALNQSATIEVVLNRAAAGSLVSSGSVTLAEVDPDLSDNSAQTSVIVGAAPDLFIQASVQPGTVAIGQPITYVFTVSNPGDVEATEVVLTAQLGANQTFVSAVSSQGTVSNGSGTVVASLGTLAAKRTATLTLQVTASALGAAVISGVVESPSDDNPANNSIQAAANVVEILGVTTITSIRAVPVRGGIRGYRIFFSDAVIPDSAGNLAAYRITAPGPDGVLGTRDDFSPRIKQIGYDIPTRAVTILISQVLPINRFVRVEVQGNGLASVLDVNQRVVDGDRNGEPGGIFLVTVASGRNISYDDPDGDRVGLLIYGPNGRMEVVRGPAGHVLGVYLVNGRPRSTRFTGFVRRRPGSDGIARIGFIENRKTVRFQLPGQRFRIG